MTFSTTQYVVRKNVRFRNSPTPKESVVPEPDFFHSAVRSEENRSLQTQTYSQIVFSFRNKRFPPQRTALWEHNPFQMQTNSHRVFCSRIKLFSSQRNSFWGKPSASEADELPRHSCVLEKNVRFRSRRTLRESFVPHQTLFSATQFVLGKIVCLRSRRTPKECFAT